MIVQAPSKLMSYGSSTFALHYDVENDASMDIDVYIVLMQS